MCRKGEAVEAWVGVVDGLVKMANVSADGKPTSFVGVGSGGWFGEGSLLKDEPRRYDIVALRESAVAYMPAPRSCGCSTRACRSTASSSCS